MAAKIAMVSKQGFCVKDVQMQKNYKRKRRDVQRKLEVYIRGSEPTKSKKNYYLKYHKVSL